jgi:hypothetical protein
MPYGVLVTRGWPVRVTSATITSDAAGSWRLGDLMLNLPY